MTKKTKELRRKAIRITIPDAPKKKQLKMAKNWKFIVKAFEKLVGQEGTTDLKELDAFINKLERK